MIGPLAGLDAIDRADVDLDLVGNVGGGVAPVQQVGDESAAFLNSRRRWRRLAWRPVQDALGQVAVEAAGAVPAAQVRVARNRFEGALLHGNFSSMGWWGSAGALSRRMGHWPGSVPGSEGYVGLDVMVY